MVVGGGAREGDQRGVWEGRVPVDIEKRPIELSEDGIDLAVGPREEPVKEREFKPALSCHPIRANCLCRFFFLLPVWLA